MGRRYIRLCANSLCLIAYLIFGAGIYFKNYVLAARGPNQNRLYTEKSCVACHDLNASKIGPSVKAIAKRYSVKDKAKLVDRVLNGSAGSWAMCRCPPPKGWVQLGRMPTVSSSGSSIRSEQGRTHLPRGGQNRSV